LSLLLKSTSSSTPSAIGSIVRLAGPGGFTGRPDPFQLILRGHLFHVLVDIIHHFIEFPPHLNGQSDSLRLSNVVGSISSLAVVSHMDQENVLLLPEAYLDHLFGAKLIENESEKNYLVNDF
jgi:hypothetical protein